MARAQSTEGAADAADEAAELLAMGTELLASRHGDAAADEPAVAEPGSLVRSLLARVVAPDPEPASLASGQLLRRPSHAFQGDAGQLDLRLVVASQAAGQGHPSAGGEACMTPTVPVPASVSGCGNDAGKGDDVGKGKDAGKGKALWQGQDVGKGKALWQGQDVGKGKTFGKGKDVGKGKTFGKGKDAWAVPGFTGVSLPGPVGKGKTSAGAFHGQWQGEWQSGQWQGEWLPGPVGKGEWQSGQWQGEWLPGPVGKGKDFAGAFHGQCHDEASTWQSGQWQGDDEAPRWWW